MLYFCSVNKMQSSIQSFFKKNEREPVGNTSTDKEPIFEDGSPLSEHPRKRRKQNVASVSNTIEENGPNMSVESVAEDAVDRTTQFPCIWSNKQWLDYKERYSWLTAKSGRLGCTVCFKVSELKLDCKRGVQIHAAWSKCNINWNGKTKESQLSSLRQKITRHKTSSAHEQAEEVLKEAAKCQFEVSNSILTDEIFDSTKRIFRTAYHVAMRDLPFTEFEKLVELQKANFGDNMGRVLHSATSGVDIISHISLEMKKRLLSVLIEKKSKITVLVDESVRMGNKETMIIFLKASVDMDSEPTCFPLELIELDNVTAPYIKEEIFKCLLKNGYTDSLLQEVLVSFCSDGASVMLGSKSGVGTLIKKDFPNIFLWHCLNHRLELAVGDALEATTGTNDFKFFLDTLYSVYSQSSKHTVELSKCSKELHKSLKKIGKVFTVRWVASSYRTVLAVWQSFPALAKHFDDCSLDDRRTSKERAKFLGLHKKLTSINFLKNLALMSDVLGELNDLSLILQNRSTKIADSHKILKDFILRIKSLATSPGDKTVDALEAEKSMVFMGVPLRSGNYKLVPATQFIDSVCQSMNLRLLTTVANKSSLDSIKRRKDDFELFFKNLSALDLKNIEDTPRYGEHEVNQLCLMFSLDQECTRRGYIKFKSTGGRDIDASMKKLFLCVDTIAVSNAECERGFSSMNRIITKERNRLTTENASHLLFIRTVGQPILKWKPDSFIESWIRAGRRPAYSATCMRRKNKDSGDTYFQSVWKTFE